MNTVLHEEAQGNLDALAKNPYPGRGLVLGLTADVSKLVLIYWIMGRSENSRNRVFSSDGGRLFTEAADPSKVKDPSLIIYDAMLEADGVYAVSNGHQTEAALAACLHSGSLERGLSIFQYEPDAPNFTPRITGVLSVRDDRPLAEIAILRKAHGSPECEREFFRYEKIPAGYGYCVTTYAGDGEPLPPFVGEPLLVPLPGVDGDSLVETYWQALDEKNRVSLAVKLVSLDSPERAVKIANKYRKV
ncbi:MAG: inosine monophosphate cyclohydrolase [Candidatus Taylorbacteria bacterium]|nr:inosine monophosphate cyclohydrolase [Candidatus Taylorbacteria bacterium]